MLVVRQASKTSAEDEALAGTSGWLAETGRASFPDQMPVNFEHL
jgi:hypothetical protein